MTELWVGDFVRFALDVLVHSIALSAGGWVAYLLLQSGSAWAMVAAAPLGFVSLVLGFAAPVTLLGFCFGRRIKPGRYNIHSAEAFPWVVGESLILVVYRSFLGAYLMDFGLLRHVFLWACGARVHRSVFVGGEVRILDPWVLDMEKGVVIGAFSVITGHFIQGEQLVIKPTRVLQGATVGGEATLSPGVEVGREAVVGSCALVTCGKSIPDGEKWVGIPARSMPAGGKTGTGRMDASAGR